jgi:hypothetical protein
VAVFVAVGTAFRCIFVRSSATRNRRKLPVINECATRCDGVQRANTPVNRRVVGSSSTSGLYLSIALPSVLLSRLVQLGQLRLSSCISPFRRVRRITWKVTKDFGNSQLSCYRNPPSGSPSRSPQWIPNRRRLSRWRPPHLGVKLRDSVLLFSFIDVFVSVQPAASSSLSAPRTIAVRKPILRANLDRYMSPCLRCRGRLREALPN